jgi:hypothetical protein
MVHRLKPIKEYTQGELQLTGWGEVTMEDLIGTDFYWDSKKKGWIKKGK